MIEVGLFFGSSTGSGDAIARRIAGLFDPVVVRIFDVMQANPKEIENFRFLIFGISTWDRNKLQSDWEDFLPEMGFLSFTDRKVALYGLGDQKTYPENFLDGMGVLYDWLNKQHAEIVGSWPVKGYSFQHSGALRNNRFVGLALDEDNQYTLTSSRLTRWVDQLKNEFGI